MAKLLTPPTLPGHPVLGSWADALGDPLALCGRAFCALGDVARVRGVAPAAWLQVSHPAGVEQVLRTRAAAYRTPTSGLAASLFGRGLVATAGDSWLARPLADPVLDASRLEAVVSGGVAAAGEVADEWEGAGEGRTVDVLAAMRHLALRATCASVLSLEKGAESDALGAALREALERLDRRPTALSAPGLSLTRRNWRALHARGVLDALLAELIRHRRASGRAQADLLGSLLRARDATTGERMDDAAVRAELFGLLLAGADTAATTLAWAWELLSRHAEALGALQAEADTVLGPRAVTPDDLPGLPYARAVVDETLRLFPPTWGLPREAVAEDEIAGYRVAPGTLVVLCRWVTHRRAGLWDEPARFDPARFLDERAAGRTPFSYYPFGETDPARGAAAELATTLAQVALATLARDFDVAAPLDQEVRPEASFTLRPRAPLRIHVAPRFGAARRAEATAGGEVFILSREVHEPGAEAERVCVVA